MKTSTQEAGMACPPARYASGPLRTVQRHAAAECASADTSSPDATNEPNRTTVLRAEHLHTQDRVPVDVVVALQWHIRDAQRAAMAAAHARSSVKGVTQASLGDVIGSTMFGALLAERREVEQQLCGDMTAALADLGVEIRSCRISDVAIPSEVRDSDVVRMLEELAQILLRHRAIRMLNS
jgi:regulator of protease activity HflC (stomatin/prohibitin superfamily)